MVVILCDKNEICNKSSERNLSSSFLLFLRFHFFSLVEYVCFLSRAQQVITVPLATMPQKKKKKICILMLPQFKGEKRGREERNSLSWGHPFPAGRQGVINRHGVVGGRGGREGLNDDGR